MCPAPDLSLSFNPIGDDGILALTAVLHRRRGLALMLPLLQWLHLVMNVFGDEGALALADCLRSSAALPSLDVLWAFGRFSRLADDDDDVERVGLDALREACDARGFVLEDTLEPGVI